MKSVARILLTGAVVLGVSLVMGVMGACNNNPQAGADSNARSATPAAQYDTDEHHDDAGHGHDGHGHAEESHAHDDDAEHVHAGHGADEHHADHGDGHHTMAGADIDQEICPVMGGRIDAEVFVEYEGRKVYFCCEACIDDFEADPDRYLAKLDKS